MKAIKISLFSVAMIMATLNLLAQSKFKLTYDYNGDAEWAFSSLPMAGGSFLVNAAFTTLSETGILMLQVNNAGVIQASKVFSRPLHQYQGSWAGSLLYFDSTYYVGGEERFPNPVDPLNGYAYPSLVKFNISLDSVWAKNFQFDTNYYYKSRSCRKTGEGDIIIYGSAANRFSNLGSFDFSIVKVDTGGNVIWYKRYGNAATDERCSSLEELNDGRLLVSGVIFNASHTTATPWVMITDTAGNVEWSTTYTRPALRWGGGFTKPAKTGGFILQGVTDTVINPGDNPNVGYLARMNDDGSFRWLKIFNSPWFTQIWDFYELDNGKIIFCGDKKDSASGRQYGYIAQVDSNGVLQWWRSYHEYPYNNNYLSCVRPAPDGGFVAVGSTFSLPNGTSQDAWIIKTDSLGCALVNCTLGVDDLAAIRKGFRVYPNPAKDEVNISLSQGLWDGQDVVTAYDITGKKMLGIYPEQGSKSLRISTKDWNAGTYIVTIQRANGSVSTEKLTIEK